MIYDLFIISIIIIYYFIWFYDYIAAKKPKVKKTYVCSSTNTDDIIERTKKPIPKVCKCVLFLRNNHHYDL